MASFERGHILASFSKNARWNDRNSEEEYLAAIYCDSQWIDDGFPGQ